MRFIDIRPLMARARAQASAPAPPDRPVADADTVTGTGWFDSSHDLRRGLDVTEVGGLETWPHTGPADASQ